MRPAFLCVLIAFAGCKSNKTDSMVGLIDCSRGATEAIVDRRATGDCPAIPNFEIVQDKEH